MRVPERWSWETEGSAARVLQDVDRDGLAWLNSPEAITRVEQDPWAAATMLLGRRPFQLRARRLQLADTPFRGYEHTNVRAALHIDQDPYLPPQIQVLMCVRPAADGGDSTFIDGWELASRIRTEDAKLYRALFEVSRVIRFSHSHWFGPTISTRLDNLLVIHGAVPPPADDRLGQAVLGQVNQTPLTSIRMTENDVIVANNHRLLHGRTAFTDPGRLLVRLLIWLEEPLAADGELVAAARPVHDRIVEQVRDRPEWIQHRLGVFGPAGLGATAFQHDFRRFPETPDSTSKERYAELAAAARALRLAA